MDSTISNRHNRSLGSVFNRTRTDKISQTLRTMRVVGSDGSQISVPFSEYQGPTPPTLELGQPGDIYIDTTPNRQTLYARYASEWKEWVGPQISGRLLHPDYQNRCLLCRLNPPNIGWYTQRFASTSLTESLSSEPSAIISAVLAKQAEDHGTKSVLGKRKHTDPIQVPTSTAEKFSQSRAHLNDYPMTPDLRLGSNPLVSPALSRTSTYSPTQLPVAQWQQNKRTTDFVTTATAQMASIPQSVVDRIASIRGATTVLLPQTQSVPQNCTLASLTTSAPNISPSVVTTTPSKPQKDLMQHNSIPSTASTIESKNISILKQEIAQLKAQKEALQKSLNSLNSKNLFVPDSQTTTITKTPQKTIFDKNLFPEQAVRANQMDFTTQLSIPQDIASSIPSGKSISQSLNILQKPNKIPIGNNVSPLPPKAFRERMSTNSPGAINCTQERTETPIIPPQSTLKSGLHRNSLSTSETSYPVSPSSSRGSKVTVRHISRDTTVVGSPEADFKRKLSNTCPPSPEITRKATNFDLVQTKVMNPDHKTMLQSMLPLNEIHLSIIFHQSGKELICRACLMETPRRMWKLMDGLSTTGLIKHCKEEHAVLCESLVKLGNDQLSNIKQQLSRTTVSK